MILHILPTHHHIPALLGQLERTGKVNSFSRMSREGYWNSTRFKVVTTDNPFWREKILGLQITEIKVDPDTDLSREEIGWLRSFLSRPAQ